MRRCRKHDEWGGRSASGDAESMKRMHTARSDDSAVLATWLG